MEESAVRLMEWYEETLDQCGLFLLEEEDLVVEHHMYAAGEGLTQLARGNEVLRRDQTFAETL